MDPVYKKKIIKCCYAKERIALVWRQVDPVHEKKKDKLIKCFFTKERLHLSVTGGSSTQVKKDSS